MDLQKREGGPDNVLNRGCPLLILQAAAVIAAVIGVLCAIF